MAGGISRIGQLQRLRPDTPSEGLEKLHGHNKNEPPARNQKVDEVAKLYEKQFLREMTKAMRGTTSISGEKTSMGESIYREQLDEQYVESWGDNGGIGLGNLIYDQLMERYFSGAGKNLKEPGGIKLTDRDVSRVNRIPTSAGTTTQVPLKIETKPSVDGSPTKLQAPWRSTVLASARMDGKTSVTLGHAGGLKSTLIFQGVPTADLEPGKVLEKGTAVGILSPEVNSFFWNLNRPQGAETEIKPEMVSPQGTGLVPQKAGSDADALTGRQESAPGQEPGQRPEKRPEPKV
jgi:flagellar protein FlgJ